MIAHSPPLLLSPLLPGRPAPRGGCTPPAAAHAVGVAGSEPVLHPAAEGQRRLGPPVVLAERPAHAGGGRPVPAAHALRLRRRGGAPRAEALVLPRPGRPLVLVPVAAPGRARRAPRGRRRGAQPAAEGQRPAGTRQGSAQPAGGCGGRAAPQGAIRREPPRCWAAAALQPAPRFH